MSDDKTFYYYFKRNLKEMGLVCPETIFEKFTFAVANTALISGYVNANHGKTVGAALSALTNSLKYSRGALVVNGVISKVAVGALELGAAYYVGGCIGSLTVASLHSHSDSANKAMAKNKTLNFNDSQFYSVADLSEYATRYKIAMSREVQANLHRHPILRQNHLNGL